MDSEGGFSSFKATKLNFLTTRTFSILLVHPKNASVSFCASGCTEFLEVRTCILGEETFNCVKDGVENRKKKTLQARKPLTQNYLINVQLKMESHKKTPVNPLVIS